MFVTDIMSLKFDDDLFQNLKIETMKKCHIYFGKWADGKQLF